MKKFVVFLMAVALSTFSYGKSLRDMWVSIPDSLIPTLDKNLRIECLDLLDMGVKPEVKNLLGTDCMLDTLTADYLLLKTSKAAVVQMKLLPLSAGDSLLCVVKAFSAPERESEVRFFNQQWKEVDARQLFDHDLYSLDCYTKAKPDTMSEENYHELLSLIEPVMLDAELAQGENVMTFRLSLPLVSNEQKRQLNALLVQRKFKWDGKIFKEN